MDHRDLDSLDYAIAGIEGLEVPTPYQVERDERRTAPAYRPTRNSDEALRLMDKYIARVVKMNNGWAAVGPTGRACFGPTLPIAICVAIVEAS